VPVTQVTALTAALEKTDHPERARGCAVPWQFEFFHPVVAARSGRPWPPGWKSSLVRAR